MLKVLKACGDIFFPRLCLNCEAKTTKEDYLCPNCQDFALVKRPLCQKCGYPKASENKTCPNCRKNQYYFDHAFAPFSYQEPLIQILKLFKYHYRKYLGRFLADKFILQLQREGFNFSEYDLITFVPLHPKKLREREYNQSEILAQEIAKSLGLEIESLLSAKRFLASQTTKSQSERKNEIKGNFFAFKELPGKSIILVDDVITTGSTASECARALKAKGAKKIAVWAIARSVN